MNGKTALVWFRMDLRLADNPALAAAAKHGRVIPLFVHAPEEEAPWQPGAASNWWLHHSLLSLNESLAHLGSRLVIRRGPTLHALNDVIRETGATAVFWNRRYEPAVIARDRAVEQSLSASGIEARHFNGSLLNDPSTIRNKAGKPFQVFTAFWNHCLHLAPPIAPLPCPSTLAAPASWPQSLRIDDLNLKPKLSWADGFHDVWQPGADSAGQLARRFMKDSFVSYAELRNRPDANGTSRLSPHLHFGEIGPRQLWHAVRAHAARNGISERAWTGSQFITELGWREFAHHLLFHFPHTPEKPLRSHFDAFAWRSNAEWLKAWQTGRTGFPIVDAGMRELWATGWMHNRVRMIAASFLVKDMLVSWQHGARWFWDTLVDADLAQNTLGWQWTAGCGADAAPFFRIFNPTLQGEKFDPEGNYVRRWIPELAKLPPRWIHRPHLAPPDVLAAAGVKRDTYPAPVLSHAIAREVAMEAYGKLRISETR